MRAAINQQFDDMVKACTDGWTLLKHRGPGQIQFWFIALGIGIAGGFIAVGFRLGVSQLQRLNYGADDVELATVAGALPWWWILALPVMGGLVVGLILNRFTPDGRVRSVAEVIEGAALYDGRVEKRAGLASGVASMITLSTGGSTGREGPVVHLAAVASSWVSNRIGADGITGRDLLGCAVAAGVSASFNAPIAGALFALEVVLRHFAVHAFAPIVIAAIAGTVISRLTFGDVTEFMLPNMSSLQFYQELPAFLILGLVSGLIAAVLMRAVFFADTIATRAQAAIGMPRWLRPACAGLILGAVAIYFPHIIGVGYETTARALTGEIGLNDAIVFAIVKTFAVAITMGGRMGGGIFSPSLVIGALAGLAFGIIATSFFPEVSGSQTLYALAGMGAVSAAVLGAPISTTLIVFELTGDWQTGLAVMAAVSLSTALASRLVHRSFFLTLLERRGVHLAAGPQAYLLATFRVGKVMRPLGGAADVPENDCRRLIEQGVFVEGHTTLEAAMPIFDSSGATYIPVVRITMAGEAPELMGALFHIDALKAYNRALAATAAEEHS